MGFFLSILYLVTNYLSPATVFGPLAAYHVELIFAVLLLVVSLPTLRQTSVHKEPQFLALIGLAFATAFSILFGAHWVGGAVHAFLDFIPAVLAFFIVSKYCNTKKKLKILILMLLFVCLFVIAHGAIDILTGVPAAGSSQSENIDMNRWNVEHPYLLPMSNDIGESFYRLRGSGEINDPNDFAQLVVCVIPLMFIFWQTKKIFQNFAFVILPVCALLLGVYLTHSRGALLALIAVAVVAAQRRVGTLPALLVAGMLFVAAMTLHFTGGRSISAGSGEDRTALWGQSLQALRTHPIFGVGYGGLGDYTEDHMTAHNSVAVCAAEIGLFGLYFWSMFLFATVHDALSIASPLKVEEGEPITVEEEQYPQAIREIEEVDKADVNRLGYLLILSLTGFLVTGWFLSRAFVITLFLLGGMVEVVYEMALQRKMIVARQRLARVFSYSGGLEVLLLFVLYFMIRALNLMR